MMPTGNQAASTARSWPRTIWVGLLALLLAIAAVTLWINDHQIWACVVGLLTIAAAFTSFTSGSAHCLNCNRKFTDQFYLGSLNECPACHTWHQYHQGKLVLVSADFIADEPGFSVSRDLLKSPPEWRLPWPGMCCVCRKPATKTGEFRIDQTVSEDLLGTKTVRSVRFDVGYCPDHKKGVDVWPFEMKFRSHAYWRDFCNLNRKHS
jgi:hypothetical protein